MIVLKLLQESDLTARQPHRAPHHVIQATTSEGLAQGPYVAARVGFKPATFSIEFTKHHHSATTPLNRCVLLVMVSHMHPWLGLKWKTKIGSNCHWIGQPN